MNMQDIGYFLYMQQQEEKQQEQEKVNADFETDLVGEQPPQTRKGSEKCFIPEIYPLQAHSE